MVVRVEYHPEFTVQFEALEATSGSEVFEDVAALVAALQTHGHDIEGTDHTADPSHPVGASSLDMWALRRTPATGFTPGANEPPVLRIPYVWMIDMHAKEEFALVFFIGDKSDTQGLWYDAAVQKIENTLLPLWEIQHQGHEARKRTHA